MVEPDCTSATASSALLNSFDFDRSIVGALSATALMLRICFVNRQCGGATRAARNCEGSGRRAHNRVGRAASSRYDEGSASIVRSGRSVLLRERFRQQYCLRASRPRARAKRLVDVKIPLQNKSRQARCELHWQHDDAMQGKSFQEHRHQKNARSTDSESSAAAVRGSQELSQAFFGKTLPD